MDDKECRHPWGFKQHPLEATVEIYIYNYIIIYIYTAPLHPRDSTWNPCFQRIFLHNSKLCGYNHPGWWIENWIDISWGSPKGTWISKLKVYHSICSSMVIYRYCSYCVCRFSTKKPRNRGHFLLSWQWAILLASPDRYGPWETLGGWNLKPKKCKDHLPTISSSRWVLLVFRVLYEFFFCFVFVGLLSFEWQ